MVNQFEQLLDYLDKCPKVKPKFQEDLPIRDSGKTELTKSIECEDQSSQVKTVHTVTDFSLLNSGIPSFSSYQKNTRSKTKFDVGLFEDIISKKLVDKHETTRAYDRPYISVGELLQCTRKTYYERKKYKVDISKLTGFPLVDLICVVGDCVHDYIQRLYPFSDCEKTLISKKYKVKGRVDAILDDTLFEIKTIDQSSIETFRDKDFDQANIYCQILNQEFDYKINHICFIYVPRSLKTIICHDSVPDIKRSTALLELASGIHESLINNIVPEYDKHNLDQCGFCYFSEHCIKDGRVADNEKKNVFLL